MSQTIQVQQLEPKIANQCLLNSAMVSLKKFVKPSAQFEFIINTEYRVLECIELSTATATELHRITAIHQPQEIYKILFELNHVRVDPKLNNQAILQKLTNTLADLGIIVDQAPNQDLLSVCYKPLGEIKDPVRFYVQDHNEVVFLASKAKPKLVVFRSE